MRELYFAYGQNPDRFITAPSPQARLPRIFAEEAIVQILAGGIPSGTAAEAGGAIEHLQILQQFTEDDRFGLLDEAKIKVFSGYLQEVGEKAQAQQKQQQLVASAGAFGGQGENGSVGAPTTTGPEDPTQTAPLQAGELAEETLPGAGGGAGPA